MGLANGKGWVYKGSMVESPNIGGTFQPDAVSPVVLGTETETPRSTSSIPTERGSQKFMKRFRSSIPGYVVYSGLIGGLGLGVILVDNDIGKSAVLVSFMLIGNLADRVYL